MSLYEDEMVIAFWQQEFAGKQNGLLILEYPLIPDNMNTYSCRSMDGIVLLDERKREVPERGIRDSINFGDKRLMVIQAKTHSLCASLIGQATFSPVLFEKFNPAYVESVGLSCSGGEEYRSIIQAVENRLKVFYDRIDPHEQIYNRETRYERIHHRKCKASIFLPECNKEKIERYFSINYKSKGTGTLIFNHPLSSKSRGRCRTEHNIILPEHGSGEIYDGSNGTIPESLISLDRKRVIAIHSIKSSARIGMYGLGMISCSVELIRHYYPTADVSGILLSKANDALLYPAVESNTDIEIIPKDIFDPSRSFEIPYSNRYSTIQ